MLLLWSVDAAFHRREVNLVIERTRWQLRLLLFWPDEAGRRGKNPPTEMDMRRKKRQSGAERKRGGGRGKGRGRENEKVRERGQES